MLSVSPVVGAVPRVPQPPLLLPSVSLAAVDASRFLPLGCFPLAPLLSSLDAFLSVSRCPLHYWTGSGDHHLVFRCKSIEESQLSPIPSRLAPADIRDLPLIHERNTQSRRFYTTVLLPVYLSHRASARLFKSLG